MGMVVTPATIELEEVIRQAVPAREGRPDVRSGNLVGTLLFFVLFNLGLIALRTPVRVAPLVWQLDWPFLVALVLVGMLFAWSVASFIRGKTVWYLLQLLGAGCLVVVVLRLAQASLRHGCYTGGRTAAGL